MRAALAPILLAGLMLPSLPVSAEPSININTGYYLVSGIDSHSIHQSVLQNGPVGHNGERFHAYTEWKLNWSYRWLESAARCRLTQLAVAVEINYMLPALESSEIISEPLKTGWERYFQALWWHEQQHKDYAIAAAQALEKSLLELPAQPCSEFQTALAVTAQQVLEDYQKREKTFDLETSHGINQGVILP